MILIFGGTTEGRLSIDVCEEAGKPFYYSTRSDMQQVDMHNGIRLTGEMSSSSIHKFCTTHNIRCIIDSTHPFAENIHASIAQTGIPIIRFQRPQTLHVQGAIYCNDFDDAVSKMQTYEIGCLLALSGVNTISKLKSYWNKHKTIFRILNRRESIETAKANEIPPEHLIYYNEHNELPSKDDEKELMRHIGCDAIITKESGISGGFDGKVNAALELGLKVFIVKQPDYSSLLSQYDTSNTIFEIVSGKYGLRRAIERIVPDFFPLKTGFSTGSCATAATKAALLSLLFDETPEEVSFFLPDGEIMSIPVDVDSKGNASVVKDFSDDPDVTRGCRIRSKVELRNDNDIVFLQGSGVGKVTLPGLGVPVGGPAINATPRKMIEEEVRNLTPYGCNITISVDNGEDIAKNTFNSKVGVIGGISIIGTTGIVSPLSNDAFVESIGRELQVARAIGCDAIGLASGKKGEDALRRIHPDLRVIHYGNFIGESLKKAYTLGFKKVCLGIMIGKAVKLAEGHLDTHSHKVQMNKEFLKHLAGTYAHKIDKITMARELWNCMPPSFFESITELCQKQCRTVFPEGELKIYLICDEKA